MKNSMLRCCRPSARFSANHLAPETHKSVQGGNAISMSHFIFKSSNASTRRCHSGCPPLHSWMSQEYASCPSRRISTVTAWLSSQATSTLIRPPPCSP
jgi:hypothetical protein